ncbi:plasmid replication protein RepB [Shewanella frigidimarina]|uniref:plasmid replication protein RepB n=2 Tax=Shewanella TaxID=22 RepID=UPI003D7A30B4
MMKLHELRLQFDVGGFVGCTITYSPLGNGYILIANAKTKTKDACMTAQRGDQLRVFKSIDAAVSAARNVGFKDILLSLH